MRNRKLLLMVFPLFILLTLAAFPLLTFAEDKETKVVATGMADGTSLQSRDQAVDDALRQAVSQGMGTFISSETLVENMILVEDKIYSETRGYIKSYEIISENKSSGTYEVKVSAIVKLEKLAGDLESIGLLMRKKQNPRVIVILNSRETNSSFFEVELEGNQNAENQVESALLSKGFQIVDAEQVRSNMEAALSKDDFSKASKLARGAGAEILISGDVKRSFVNEKELYGRNMRFFSNEIRLKALETDTAKVLYSGFKTKPPSAINALFPLEEAANELIDDMVAGILDKWRKDVYQIGTFQLSLSGASFKDISEIKKGLENIRGLGGVQIRDFQSGNALLDVKYKGTLEELAEKVGQIKAPALKVIGFKSNTLELKIAK